MFGKKNGKKTNGQKPPVRATTQSFVEIEDIKDDIVLMKNYAAAIVVEVGAINYWLLSQDEQESVIVSYGNFLNSLSFPVQILIQSSRMDISSYLEYLADKANKQQDEGLKKRLLSYQEFIKNTVKTSTVLQKRFFFAIPFSPFELGIQGPTSKSLNKEYVISRAKTSLYPKRDHLLRLLVKVGLKAKALDQQTLTELFYNLYNPSLTGRQLAPVESYTKIVHTS